MSKWLPKGLMARSLTILFVPLFFVQIVLTYIYVDRHTETILKVLSSTIAGDIALVHEWVEKKHDINRIKSLAKKHLHLDVEWSSHKKLKPTVNLESGWLYDFMNEALKNNLSAPYFISMDRDQIKIIVECEKGVLIVKSPRKRLFSRTTPLVLIWTFATAIILFIIAALFMRNQVRPILRLAKAADAFGQGQDAPFKPEGAKEVKQAGSAFIKMRERLQFQLTERMQMLAGVSHDLKTVLTRMKLELALHEKTMNNKDLVQDVNTMQSMVEEFLQYSYKIHSEETVSTDIYKICQQLQHETREFPLEIKGLETLWASVRPIVLYRSLINIVLNCKRHATKAEIELTNLKDEWQVCIDDDGPGIPEEEKEKACQPFYRMDSARNLDQGGVGLGLTIARDGIHAHGGNLYLENSPLGGLRVRVIIPHLT